MARTISVLAIPGVQLLDVSGPLDVFAEANRQTGREEYRLQVVGLEAGSIRSSSGVRLVADATIGEQATGADTLLAAGAPGVGDQPLDPRLKIWLRREALDARRYGSVCSGAFLLAAAGLLEGGA